MSHATTQDSLVPVFLDFETRSGTELKVSGGRGYVRGPDTEVLCAVAIVEGHGFVWGPWSCGETALHRQLAAASVPPAPTDAAKRRRREVAPWLDEPLTWHLHLGTEDVPAMLARRLLASRIDVTTRPACLVAHNAHGFDRHVWDAMGYPAPAGGWRDSLNLARRAGLPGSLDKCAESIYGRGKDAAGRKIMLRLSKPQKRRPRDNGSQPTFEDPSPFTFAPLVRYCALDVVLLAALWVDCDLGAPHPDDEVLAVHERIDERGVPIDLGYVRELQEAEARVCLAALERAAEALGWLDDDTPDVPRVRELVQSPAKLGKFLNARGVKVDDCKGDTLERVRVDLARVDADASYAPAAGPTLAVIDARLAVANVVRSKLDALLAQTCPDGRLRGALAYYGAQATGRWAGRGAQLQNFTREVDWREVSPLGRRPEPHEMTTIAEVQGALRGVIAV